MTCLSLRCLALTGLLLQGIALSASAREATPVIPLPPVLAVEMPRGATSLGLDDPPLSDLLAARQIAGHLITASLPQSRVGVSATRSYGPPGAVHLAASQSHDMVQSSSCYLSVPRPWACRSTRTRQPATTGAA